MPTFLVLLTQPLGLAKLAEGQIPGIVREAKLHWMGLPLPPHLWPPLYSLQSSPTSPPDPSYSSMSQAGIIIPTLEWKI